jgi:hypothetical protein
MPAALAMTVAVGALTAAVGGSAWGGVAAAAAAPSWRIVKHLPGGVGGYAVTAAGPHSEWAFGGNGHGKPTAWRNSGAGWSQVAFPGTPGEQVTAAGASSASNVWVFTDHVGDAGGGVGAMRWNGKAWSEVGLWYIDPINSVSVLSPTDVWVFGAPMAWHWNGKGWWMVSAAGGGAPLVDGGSGRSADDAWVYGALGGAAGAAGNDLAHWNGKSWKNISVASLLLNGDVNSVYEQSPDSVYALGTASVDFTNGNPGGTELILLHWNGSAWSRVLRVPAFSGTDGKLSGDGHGGLWLADIIMPLGRELLHYSDGALGIASMPSASTRIQVYSAAPIPGTESALAAGYTITRPGGSSADFLLQYGS